MSILSKSESKTESNATIKAKAVKIDERNDNIKRLIGLIQCDSDEKGFDSIEIFKDINRNVDLGHRNDFRQTFLMLAVKNNCNNIIRELFKNGCDNQRMLKDILGQNIFHYCGSKLCYMYILIYLVIYLYIKIYICYEMSSSS